MKHRPSTRSLPLSIMLRYAPGVVLACGLTAVAAAQPYGLQYGAQRDRAAAEQLKTELEQQNLGPVTFLSDAEWHRVVVGRYRVFVDAQIAKDDVRQRTGREVFIRAIPATNQSVYTDPTAAITPYFRNLSGERVTSAPESLKGNAAYERLEALDTPGNKEAYAAALRAELPGLSDSNPLKGYVLTNLGIVEIIAERYDAALELLRPVADGDVAAAKAHRVMAMRRVAWITHWQKNDRLAAYRAYRELEKFSGSESVKSLCKVECAGLLMELAESGKGTHEEVRAEIAKDLAEIPQTDAKNRAVLELMNTETWSRQPNPEFLRAALLGDEFIARYTPLNRDKLLDREVATAIFQTGVCYLRAGQREKAGQYFSKVITDYSDKTESFAGVNLEAQALHGYALIAADGGDLSTAKQVMRNVVEMYPADGLSKAIQESQKADTSRNAQPLVLITDQE
jgi:tetratricopeptide (TPR) repeat protein